MENFDLLFLNYFAAVDKRSIAPQSVYHKFKSADIILLVEAEVKVV